MFHKRPHQLNLCQVLKVAFTLHHCTMNRCMPSPHEREEKVSVLANLVGFVVVMVVSFCRFVSFLERVEWLPSLKPFGYSSHFTLCLNLLEGTFVGPIEYSLVSPSTNDDRIWILLVGSTCYKIFVKIDGKAKDERDGWFTGKHKLKSNNWQKYMILV